MRPRLTPEEKEARRKARNAHTFSDAAYRHYDTSGGFGSAEEWFRKAGEALGENPCAEILGKGKAETKDQDLLTLFLTAMPATLAELQTGFRKALFKVHPDHGGTADATIEAFAAFKRLAKKIR
jgi:hypothetical protein